MEYTLDSLRQVEKALKGNNKNLKIISEPVIISGADMSGLYEKNNIYYFGVLTAGTGVNCQMLYNGNEILTVEASSQIIEVFSDLKFTDGAGAEVEPKGLFRGFIISLQY